jgi:hypothetical protein
MPFALIPFTYVSSYCFKSDSSAQTGTIFFHFFILGIMGAISGYMRITPGSENMGDFLLNVLKVVPSFLITSTIACDTNCDLVAFERSHSLISQGNQVEGDKWHVTNMPLDLILMGVHSIVFTVILICIERGVFSNCRSKRPLPTNNQVHDHQKEQD